MRGCSVIMDSGGYVILGLKYYLRQHDVSSTTEYIKGDINEKGQGGKGGQIQKDT